MADEQNLLPDVSTELVFRVNDLPRGTHRVLAASPAQQIGAGTLSVWADLTGMFINNRLGIFAKDAQGIGNHSSFYIVNGNLVCVMQAETGQVDARIIEPMPEPNRLDIRHFVFTFGPGGMRLYVDGDFIAQNPITIGLSLNVQPVVIGAVTFGSTHGQANDVQSIYPGKIVEVALFKGQISAGQVDGLYEDLPGADVRQPEDPTNQAPSPPTNLRSTLVTSNQVALAWDASSDPEGGLVRYRIYRGVTVIAQDLTIRTFTDSLLQPETTYSYQVEAQDPAGLVSSRSNVLTLMTTAGSPAQNQPPTTPTGLMATAVGLNSAFLSWAASSDPDGVVVNYIVRRGGIVVGQRTITSFNDTGLQPDTEYAYTVQAVDDDGALSGLSSPIQIHTDEEDDVPPPLVPTGFMALHAQPFRVHLVWNASPGQIAYYVVRRDGAVISQSPTLTKIDTNVIPRQTYRYTVEAVSAQGLGSGQTGEIVVTTPDLVQTPGTVDPLTRARVMGLENRMIRSLELMGSMAVDFEQIANLPPPGC